MAQEAIITQQSLVEAGIAASMAANPNVLPEPSVYFQDFNFGATMWDAAYGNVDGGSVSGVGASVSDIAIEERIKLETEERKKDDPASDAGMIVELAKQQREEAVRFTNGTYYLNGMAISEVEMNEALSMTRAELDEIAEANNWTASQRAEAERVVDRAENTTGEERSKILSDADHALPGLTDAVGDNVLEIRSRGATSELSGGEQRVEENERTVDTDQRISVRLNQDVGERSISRGEQVANLEQARNGMSNAGNTFDSGYSPSTEFNAQAAGNTQLAEATPPQSTPNLTGPGLS